MNKPKHIAITGAGLVGSLLSVYMAKRGFKVDVYERRPDSRKTQFYQGRSINLALSDRGWKALDGVGLADKVKSIAIPMYRRVMHSIEGNLSYQPYGKNNQAIYSVSRGLLNQLLLDEAETFEGVNLHFEHSCKEIDWQNARLSFQNESGSIIESEFDYVFGADGAFSAVRNALMKTDRFSYEQEYIDHGYKELSIPAAANGGFQMEKEALHIWPRGEYMLIALPNPDATFTCTLFFPFEGQHSFSTLNTPQKARAFFETVFPDALSLMPHFDNEWSQNPNSSLCIIRCKPWIKGKTALIGDAAHAIVPFYGQGMNAGFEDCRILNDILENSNNWFEAMEIYNNARKSSGDAIAELAMRNFIEMRDLTADPVFLLRKKIEARFADRYPSLWTPLYSMVTFSHMPYEEALRLGKLHDKIMGEVMQRSDIAEMWDSPEVEASILELAQRYL